MLSRIDNFKWLEAEHALIKHVAFNGLNVKFIYIYILFTNLKRLHK